MKLRIVKKSFKGNSVYLIQKKYFLIPLWFNLTEDSGGLYEYVLAFEKKQEAVDKFNELVAARDFRPERVETEIVGEE